MKTDKLFYRIFLENPSLISELLPDIPPNCEFEYSAPVIKETEFRLDGILSPTAQDLDLPLIFLEAQMQSDEGFYRRYFAELFLYLQQYPTARPWRGLLIFRSREQKLGSEKAYETLLEQQVQRLYLNDLLSLTNLSSNLGLLKLLVVRKSGVATTAKEILAKARNTQEFRQQLELIEVILANLTFPVKCGLQAASLGKGHAISANRAKGLGYREEFYDDVQDNHQEKQQTRQPKQQSK